MVVFLKIGMGQVKNGRMFKGIGAADRKKQKIEESLQTTSLFLSNAKSTQLVLLISIKYKKIKHENFNFVHFLSSSSSSQLCIIQKVYSESEYYPY